MKELDLVVGGGGVQVSDLWTLTCTQPCRRAARVSLRTSWRSWGRRLARTTRSRWLRSDAGNAGKGVLKWEDPPSIADVVGFVTLRPPGTPRSWSTRRT